MEVDLHIHSKYSRDSFLSPRSIVRTAKSKGLSAIAVTDHDTVVGALETAKISREDLVVIPGIEVRTNIGDLVSLFVEEEVASRDFYEVVDETREQNGLVVLPHPLRGHGKISSEVMHSIDVVEVLNGRSLYRENTGARELALSYGKPMISGSDAHFNFEIGCVRTILSDVSSSMEELRKSIAKDDRSLVGSESPFIVRALSFGAEMVKRTASSLRS